jgi:hypothetical protein
MSSNKIDLNSLSEDDREMYLSERLNKFKLTVTICTIYSLIAVVLLIVAIMTSWGQKILYEEMFPFVMTFVIGTVAIVIYLAIEVYNFQPTKTKGDLGTDAELCPDYWKLVYAGDQINKEDVNGKKFLHESQNKSQFNYKCVMDPTVFDKDKVASNSSNIPNNILVYGKDLENNNYLYRKTMSDWKDSGISDTNDQKLFKEYLSTMAGYKYDKTADTVSLYSSNAIKHEANNYFKDTNIPIVCDTAYPLYLSVMDNQYQIKNPDAPSNKFRCAYAKACNISWTEAGCSS